MNKEKILFNCFLKQLESYIKKKFEENKNEISYEDLKTITKETQIYVLHKIKDVIPEKNIQNSVFLEKIARLINNIFNIVVQCSPHLVSEHIFTKVFQESRINIKKESIIEDIKHQNKCKENYCADSYNIILDFEEDKTFEQYVHATSNIDTQSGQGKLLFNVNQQNNQHIYIFEKILKDNHKGTIFDLNNKRWHELNLLPFLSMITKILPFLSKITHHENLVYFFRTPILIMSDQYDTYHKYNEKISSLYSKEKITDREWFFSNFFERNNESEIENKILNFLKEYTLDMIEIIILNNINSNLQKNEKVIIQQLYNLVNSVLFLDKNRNNIDYSYANKTSLFLNGVVFFDNNHESLGLKRFDISEPILVNNIEERTQLEKMCARKSIIETLKLRLEADNRCFYKLKEFLIEIGNHFLNKKDKLQKILDELDNKKIIDILNDNKFKNILNKEFIENHETNWNNLGDIFFYSFPNLFRNCYLDAGSNNKYIYALLYLFLTNTEKQSLLIFFQEHLKRYGSSGYENLFNMEDQEWQIYLCFELFYPLNNMNFTIKKDLKLKKIIHEYSFYYASEKLFNKLTHDLNMDDETDVKNLIRDYENYKNDDTFFEYLLSINKKYNLSPIDFSSFLRERLHPYILINLVDFLEVKKDNSYLKESLLWILSNKHFEYDYDFILVYNKNKG